MFSYEALSEATMLTDDYSTSGLAEDWFESECNVFNSFAAWMSESLDSIKWQVAVLLWTNGIHNNKWLVWGAGEYTKYSTDLETWQVFLWKYCYVYLVHKQRYLMPEGINARVSRYYICWHSITIVCYTFVQQLEICN